MWQDWVFSIGQWLFIAALIPALIHPRKKPPLMSSAPTAAVIYVFAFTYFTLQLWWSTVAGLALAALWTALAVQRYRMDTREKNEPVAEV